MPASQKRLAFTQSRIWSRAVLLLPLLWLGCEEMPPIVYVQLKGLFPAITTVRVTNQLNDDVPYVVSFYEELERFSISLPAGSRGLLQLQVEGVASDLCVRSRGNDKIQIHATGQFQRVINLDALVLEECPGLEVEVEGGGRIQSEPAGIDCPLKNCQFDFSPRTPLRLEAQPKDHSFYFAGWSLGCVGDSPTCALIAQQQMPRARATFRKKMCTATNVCLEYPADGNNYGRLFSSVTGTDDRNVYVVGYPNSYLHYDGQHWTEESIPLNPWLLDAMMVPGSKDEVVAVGSDLGGAIYRRKNKQWSRDNQYSLGNRRLYAIDGSSATNLMAVGDQGKILRFDGAKWSEIGDPAYADMTFADVLVTGPNDAIVVGGNPMTSVVLRWDGSTWKPVGGLTGRYNRVAGSSAHDFILQGSEALTRVQADSPQSIALPSSDDLQALFAYSLDDFYVLDEGGRIHHYQAGMFSTIDTEHRSGFDIHPLWGSPNGGLFLCAGLSIYSLPR